MRKSLMHLFLTFFFAITGGVLLTASAAAQTGALPALRGEKAIEQLKQNGQYDSLMEAVEAARRENGQTENPAAENAIVQSSKLTDPDGAAFDDFGHSVAISGNTAIVGAYQDAIGGNGAQGSVFVFIRIGTNWNLIQKLTAADGATGDHFGVSLAIDGETIIVGASLDNEGSNPDQGSAYVFVRSGGSWTQQQKLTSSDGAEADYFGVSVAISGDTAIVGAYYDDIGANPNQGSAYVFVRNGTVWTEQQKLFAADGEAGDFFGYSLAIDGNTAIVGAWMDDIGANFNQGSAYVFVRSGTVWTLQQKLTASDGAASDTFGVSIAIDGETAVIGAFQDTIGANFFQGSAYVFVRSGTIWSEQQKLIAADGAGNDQFGVSVAIDGDRLIVGAFEDDFGTNFGQGSAYVFVRSGANWTEQQKLAAADGRAGDRFGFSVAISGNKILVGAPRADIPASNPLVSQVADQGAVYVFVPQVFIGGRILTPDGRGVPNAIVQLSRPNDLPLMTRSSSFGYYRFDELRAGEIALISVSSKWYQFTPRLVEANDNIADLDFTGF